jgi:hypothetical protein
VHARRRGLAFVFVGEQRHDTVDGTLLRCLIERPERLVHGRGFDGALRQRTELGFVRFGQIKGA